MSVSYPIRGDVKKKVLPSPPRGHRCCALHPAPSLPLEEFCLGRLELAGYSGETNQTACAPSLS